MILVDKYNMPHLHMTSIVWKHVIPATYLVQILGTLMGSLLDYYSFFIYERPMPDMSSETLILALKIIFSESGKPTILISDNGCQYCSEEFKQFSLELSFVHKTSSPYYLKGNSYAERAVGVVKEIYSKCKEEFLLGLLVHWSTPLLYPNAIGIDSYITEITVIWFKSAYFIMIIHISRMLHQCSSSKWYIRNIGCNLAT